MRILHLIKHCDLANGHVNVAVDLACVHAGRGHEVAVGSGGGGFVEFLQARGIRHATIPSGKSPLAIAGALAATIALCRTFRPDIIHAHMMSSAVLGYLASRLLRVPLVTTMHNSFDQHSGLMRLGDMVVAVSEVERTLLLSRGYRAEKVVTIRNGTVGSPRESMTDVAPPIEFPKPCIATVCGLHSRKGVHHLIAAFARVSAAHPEWYLNIIGEGPDAAKLRAQADDLGLGGKVRFLGRLRNPKPLLKQADIFALASLAEPSALVLVEGRAAGCAMVATEVGGTAEALAFGAAGHLVEPANPDAMASVFDMLMGHPERLAQWRSRALEGLEAYHVDRTAAKYLAVYEGLCQRAALRSTPEGCAPPTR